MRIDRLEVSGGFLDDLEINFTDGLNVLIGARGAGKTSVLELIRFGLGLPAITEEAGKDAFEQALAVLGDGTVTVYCSVGGDPLVFTRTGFDEVPSASRSHRTGMPLIVSQNEIEQIGLDPKSRREILDRLIDPSLRAEMEGTSRSEVASIERRLEIQREEREEAAEEAERKAELSASLEEAEKKQKKSGATLKKLEKLQVEVAEQSDQLGQLRAAADSYRQAGEGIGDWAEELRETQIERSLPELSSAATESQVAKKLSKAEDLVERAVAELEAARSLVGDAASEENGRATKLQEQLKKKTENLEKLQKGAGDIGRRVSALRQELKAVAAQEKRVKQLDKEIAKLVGKRDRLLDEDERAAEARYAIRKKCASQLTKRFNHRIEVRVDKSGEVNSYQAALVEVLQGSNLRYKNLAARLAESVSPRELAHAVEAEDPERLARLCDIPADRARKLLAHFETHSLSPLLLAPLDDSVDFALLDGQDYKVSHDLSMGQRCTVVLPMLLAEEREAVVLDQPEDHLDNAFIVETLVSAISKRSEGGQVIVATHNANIPVLGEAMQVIVLASDGRRGFVASVGGLDSDKSVHAITTLMEGGREAFAQRAEFYDEHPDG
jgi:DNA repair ATPase RecN